MDITLYDTDDVSKLFCIRHRTGKIQYPEVSSTSHKVKC